MLFNLLILMLDRVGRAQRTTENICFDILHYDVDIAINFNKFLSTLRIMMKVQKGLPEKCCISIPFGGYLPIRSSIYTKACDPLQRISQCISLCTYLYVSFKRKNKFIQSYIVRVCYGLNAFYHSLYL